MIIFNKNNKYIERTVRLIVKVGDIFLDNIEKAKSYPPGTVRSWNGIKYRKDADGKWKRVASEKRPQVKEEDTKEIGKTIASFDGMDIIQYSDKAIIIKGDTYNKIEYLRELKEKLGIGGWNSTIRGWVFPSRHTATILGYLNSKLSDDIKKLETIEHVDDKEIINKENELEKLNAIKNALPVDTNVLVGTDYGKIKESRYNQEEKKLEYLVSIKKKEIWLSDDKVKALSETDDKKISEKINEATPESRIQKVKEITGEGNLSIVEEIEGTPIHFEPQMTSLTVDNFMKEGLKTFENVPDYTEARPKDIMLVDSKKILEIEKPPYIPDVDMNFFERSRHRIEAVKISENKYIIKTNAKSEKMIGKNYYILTPEFSIVSRDVLAATQDYYLKKAKALALSNKKRIKTMTKNRMTYSHSDLIGFFRPELDYNNKWKHFYEVMDDIRQKVNDMEVQKEEDYNTYSKGQETSYGNVGTKNDLLESHGVKVKRQNGSEITEPYIKQIRNALDFVYKAFGNRSSMSKKWDLKISHSGDVLMHARRAAGLFIPSYHAIGVSGQFGNYQFGYTLAHEYAHFMDYWIGEKNDMHFGSDKAGSLENDIASTFRKNLNKKTDSKYTNRTCECFARAFELYFVDKMGSEEEKKEAFSSPNKVSKEVFENSIKPKIEQFFEKNNEILKSLRDDMLLFNLH